MSIKIKHFLLISIFCANFNPLGFGQVDINVAKAYFYKADTIYKSSFDSSIIYFEKCLPALIREKEWKMAIKALIKKGSISKIIGDFNQFHLDTKRGYELAEKHLKKGSFLSSAALNNLAFYYSDIGDNDRAIHLYKKCIENDESFFGAHIFLFSLYVKNGEFSLAEKFANEIFQKFSKTKLGTARGLKFLANVGRFKIKNQDNRGLDYLYKAKSLTSKIKLNKSDSLDLFDIYFYLAEYHLEGLNLDSTSYYLNSCLKINGNLGIVNDVDLLLLNSKLNLEYGSYEKAKNEIYRSINLLHDKEIVKRGLFFYEMGQIFEFEDLYPDSALYYFLIAKNTFKACELEKCSYLAPNETIPILFSLANHYINLYEKNKIIAELELASKTFEELVLLKSKLLSSFITRKSKLFLQENSVSIIEGAIEVCHELYKRTGEEQYLEQAFAYAENLKAKTLLGEMRENDALKLTGLPDTLREQERDLRIEIAFYERQINEEKQKKESEEEKIKMWESELFQLNNDYNDLITGIEDDFPKFKMMRNYQNELNISEIRNQLLDEETLILEYFVGEKQAYVFALGKNELQLIPLDSSTFISNEGEALLQYINAPPITGSNVSSTLQKQADFSNAIFHKAMGQLKNDYKKIIVIPDNVLSYLPFEALLDEGVNTDTPMLPKEAYVLDDYQFSYNYSVVLLLNKLEQEASAKEAFVGYSPSFSDKMTEATRSCTTDELYSLRCSEKEITSISEILGGKTYTGTLAGKDAFKTEAANYKIIHLATHACIDEENPRFNKIYLADDYLSNGDIQNMDFSADLAVLSACNTGTGKLAKGEGVLSLSRDFIYAGCASILTSLWSVDDCSTSDIMVNYYQNLADGLPKDASLQKAKIDFMDSGDKLKSHPYYWAPFVQIGNTEPLDLGKGMAWYWWLFGGVGALAALGIYRKFNS